MTAARRLAWRVLGIAAFGATAALAVALSSRAPVDARLIASGNPDTATTVVAPRCAESGLRVGVRPRGSGRFDVEFTNVSAAACQLGGYPQLVAVDGARSLGGVTGRLGPALTAVVVLRPGATAHAPAEFSLGACRTVAISGLRVGSDARYARYAAAACEYGGHVLLLAGAIRPGR